MSEQVRTSRLEQFVNEPPKDSAARSTYAAWDQSSSASSSLKCPVFCKSKSKSLFGKNSPCRQMYPDDASLLDHCVRNHKVVCPICELKLREPQTADLNNIFFKDINFARAHVRCVHLKSWCCSCGKRFGASTKLKQHVNRTGCPARPDSQGIFFNRQLEALNKRLANAKTTNDLKSILLHNGNPIYDYASGPNSGPDVPQPPAPIPLPVVLPAPSAPNPDSGRGTGAATGDYELYDMKFDDPSESDFPDQLWDKHVEESEYSMAEGMLQETRNSELVHNSGKWAR